mgnify:CR=1 FL=1
MSYSFEYIDIILLAMIAGFIFLRLRGILGKRTGFEGKAPPKFEEVLNKIKTEKVQKINENFDDSAKKEFLEGAKIAYETIITDFSDNDNKIVASKPLLSKEILNQFNETLKVINASLVSLRPAFGNVGRALRENLLNPASTFGSSAGLLNFIPDSFFDLIGKRIVDGSKKSIEDADIANEITNTVQEELDNIEVDEVTISAPAQLDLTFQDQTDLNELLLKQQLEQIRLIGASNSQILQSEILLREQLNLKGSECAFKWVAVRPFCW